MDIKEGSEDDLLKAVAAIGPISAGMDARYYYKAGTDSPFALLSPVLG